MVVLVFGNVVLRLALVGHVQGGLGYVTIVAACLLVPVVKAAGIDPAYFGVLFIMNNAIGLITPPVGTVAQCCRRRRQDEDGCGHPRRDPVHDRRVCIDVPAGILPLAGDGSGEVVREMTESAIKK